MRVTLIGVVVLFSMGATTAGAQQREYGFKVGPTISTIVYDSSSADSNLPAPGEDQQYRRKTAAGGGGFLVLPLTGPLAVQIEALFSPKGGKLPEGADGGTLLINYVEFPLLARITPVHSPSTSFHVFAGPSVDFRLNAQFKVAQSGGGITSGFKDDVTSSIEPFELAVIAGGGLNIGRHAVVDARYSWGLSRINKEDATLDVRNRALAVLVGFRF
jgi:hypothetical protein